VATRSKPQRQLAPGVAARLARPRDARCAPELLSGRRVPTGNEADVLLVARASRNAGDHLASNDDGAGAVLVAKLAVSGLHIPHNFAGPGIQRDQMRIARRAEDFVVE